VAAGYAAHYPMDVLFEKRLHLQADRGADPTLVTISTANLSLLTHRVLGGLSSPSWVTLAAPTEVLDPHLKFGPDQTRLPTLLPPRRQGSNRLCPGTKPRWSWRRPPLSPSVSPIDDETRDRHRKKPVLVNRHHRPHRQASRRLGIERGMSVSVPVQLPRRPGGGGQSGEFVAPSR